MIDGLSVLALITARGGSKRLAGKNLRTVGGRTLVARAIEAARAAETVDRVVLSSDDAEIIAAALAAGCEVPFVRPPELATDTADSIAVVHHALRALPECHDLVVLLQPTSPLRDAADVDGAVRRCVASGAPACMSVTAYDKPPHKAFALDAAGRLRRVLPPPGDGGAEPAVYVNGAVYVARTEWLVGQRDFASDDTVGYPMPKARAVDIDDETDLVVAEALARHLAGTAVDGRPAATDRAAGAA